MVQSVKVLTEITWNSSYSIMKFQSCSKSQTALTITPWSISYFIFLSRAFISRSYGSRFNWLYQTGTEH